jgi:hypothetical protein
MTLMLRSRLVSTAMTIILLLILQHLRHDMSGRADGGR